MENVFNQMAFGIYGTNGTNGTIPEPLVPQMPLVPSAKQFFGKMNATHRYTLEPYAGMNSRYQCPNCRDKRKSFVRYIDTLPGNQFAGNINALSLIHI